MRPSNVGAPLALALLFAITACDGPDLERGEGEVATRGGALLGLPIFPPPDEPEPEPEPAPGPAETCSRTTRANVVAIDQVITYNRFGAFNPVGMIYALERDVVAVDRSRPVGPGNARLRADKRPRPIVLRVNEGDCLEVRFTNWLAPSRDQIPLDDGLAPIVDEDGELHDLRSDAPFTRSASFHVNGMEPMDLISNASFVGDNPSGLAAPGQTLTYRWYAAREGAFLVQSMAALFGGQGNGGSMTHGLFGAVNVEPRGSTWYRSQVTAAQLAAAQRKNRYTGAPVWNPDGTPQIDFDAVDASGTPILRIANVAGEIVHNDVNAVITGVTSTAETTITPNEGHFREFTVLFHDELKTVQAFRELEEREMLHGVRDGFGINYGASGLGSELLANRKKIGPTKNCPECKFEEFFLESWANGDPALNVDRDENGVAVAALFPDDPSNVHHSYLGDPVRFRNLHAGPKETHVFHLHAQQWLHSPGDDDSTYLDSQTIGPGSSFSYDIAYGGAGNRNLTVGDSIFHCHLYPHFAQGMWSLWRSHDVFEPGTVDRNLPDAEIAQGTPNPAVVPIPGRGMPPMPTYAPSTVTLASGGTATRPALPGFPFYIPGVKGHRPPQPPLDLEHDGGLPRHVMTSVPADDPTAVVYGHRGEFDVEIHKANLKLLPHDGTPQERAAMQFHAGQFPNARRVTSRHGWPAAAYPAYTPEGAAAKFLVNGQPPKPGAPFSEPCKPGSPERNYRAAYVQVDLQVNSEGWHDPQARLMVLEGDVQATLDGTRRPEPFFFRANSGECVNFTATNLIPDVLQADDFQIFTPTDTIGQHIHLVKFDVTSSDGAGNGWNYEDGTFAADDVRARIEAANALGGAFPADGTLEEKGPRQWLTAKVHPRIPNAPLGAQSTVQRWWADPLVNGTGGDRTIRTVFTHDHFTPSSAQHHGFYGALVVEPAGSVWRDPKTGERFGTRDDGGPTSYRADILTADPSASFREFNLAFADYGIVYDAYGAPVNAPTYKEAALPKAIEHPAGVVAPESISAADPGTMLVNYRNEPIPLRLAQRNPDGTWMSKSGAAGEVANVFRSDVHGDPDTPLLEVYEGDRVQIRMIQGAQEDQHSFTMHGLRWLHEPSDPDSGFVNGQAIGISEHMEFSLDVPMNKNLLGAVDFMYQSASSEDLWNGLWGLMRAHGKAQASLLPLPNNLVRLDLTKVAPTCPSDAPKRRYKVHAITARGNLPGGRLVYNDRQDLYDPDAILFVQDVHLAAVRSGARKPEPLMLRAAAGDCIEVTLVNELPPSLSPTPHWNFVTPITEGFNVNQVPMSSHVSLHPQLVQYDVGRADGANVGHNAVQTVAPGGSRTYQWYAGRYEVTKLPSSGLGVDLGLIDLDLDFALEDPTGSVIGFKGVPVEYGAINLRDMADVVHHGMHGGVGTLIVEPEGATWATDPGTNAQATVSYVGRDGATRSFREFVLVYQDELALFSDRPELWDPDPRNNSGRALRNLADADDAEDTGHKGFNYRTEPLWARAGLAPHADEGALNDIDQSALFSSRVHGDPATPVFTAKVGTPMRFRVLQPSGHARQHAFTVHGAEWRHHGWASGAESKWIGENEHSSVINTQGGASVMRAWNISPIFGAGGSHRVPGDYLYLDSPSPMVSDGLWGLVRVTP